METIAWNCQQKTKLYRQKIDACAMVPEGTRFEWVIACDGHFYDAEFFKLYSWSCSVALINDFCGTFEIYCTFKLNLWEMWMNSTIIAGRNSNILNCIQMHEHFWGKSRVMEQLFSIPFLDQNNIVLCAVQVMSTCNFQEEHPFPRESHVCFWHTSQPNRFCTVICCYLSYPHLILLLHKLGSSAQSSSYIN